VNFQQSVQKSESKTTIVSGLLVLYAPKLRDSLVNSAYWDRFGIESLANGRGEQLPPIVNKGAVHLRVPTRARM
jgi:hypothetical protein